MGKRVDYIKEIWADIFGLAFAVVVFITLVDIVIVGRSSFVFEGNLYILYFETVLAFFATALGIDRIIDDIQRAKK